MKSVNRYTKTFFMQALFSFCCMQVLQAQKVQETNNILHKKSLLKNLRQDIQKNMSLTTKKVSLRYLGKKDNYLVFYDHSGNTAYFRYREDRFADLAEKRLPSLIKGELFLLEVQLLGIDLDGVFVHRATEEKVFKDLIKKSNSIIVFSFISAKNLLLEKVIL